MTEPAHSTVDGVAIIGMACRFPDADDPEQFWRNLVDGRESITHFTDEELEGVEYDFESVRGRDSFVKARGLLHGVDMFDARFFGFTPREAAVLDPQQRVWLECAWEGLERAGHDPQRFDGAIGVYAGSYVNSYLLNNLIVDREYIDRLVRFRAVDAFQNIVSNDKDYLPTRTSYKLDLRGPSVNVQTACSTSLVAVHHAVQSLLGFESDMCIAGGACITFPQLRGYLYQEGGMVSPDGRCRPFDAGAAGTVFSSGVGLVVLRRLEDALRDGDRVLAVIRGSAINNDGSLKVSYSAPSVDGQAEVVAMAQAVADIDPRTVSYVEAHGTGTPLGDPIEVAGLTKAFRAGTDERQFCAIGSVKSNVGHLDSAAGIAGLIKTVQALRHRTLPASLHYEAPNPEIDFDRSPFYVVDSTRPWSAGEGPLRAGVSSFGVGGTNAHVVLEEAPAAVVDPEPSGPQLLLLSAKTDTALDAQAARLASHLEEVADTTLPDVAWTLQTGRRRFAHRRAVVCASASDGARALRGERSTNAFTTLVKGEFEGDQRSVVFMFPGQGAQHPGMGRGLYESEPEFARWIDRCAELMQEPLGVDVRELLLADPDDEAVAARLRETRLTQPALFALEYALARLWMHQGVRPDAMIGHSVGEYVAACLAGVLSLEDAAHLIVLRGRLMQEQPGGDMLAVRAPAPEVEPFLTPDVTVAAVNAPNLCVVSGPSESVAAVAGKLAEASIEGRILETSHAFHSAMMDAAVEPFVAAVSEVERSEPRIPIVSTLTGKWVGPADLADPGYWGRQIREAVRFSDGVLTLLEDPGRVLVEVGPGRTLSTLARQHRGGDRPPRVVTSMRQVTEDIDDVSAHLRAVGGLWTEGVDVDWAALHHGAPRRRVLLPTYPFERSRHWVDAPTPASAGAAAAPSRAVPVPPLTTADVPMTPPAPAPPAEDRRTRILARLKSVLYELSGIEIGDGDVDTTFIELGLDSLFLTQASAGLEEQFGLKIGFRELLEDITTVNLLADHLDRELPADAMPAPAAPVPAPAPGAPALPAHPGMVPTGEVPGDLQGLIQAQLQIMATQLEVMRGHSGQAPATTGAEVGAGASSSPARSADDLRLPTVERPEDGSAPLSRFGPYRTIERAKDGGLTPAQEAHLADLTARYVERTGTSKRLADETRPDLADPRSVAGFRRLWKEMVYQIVADRSEGAHIWDVDGNEYVDITMGFGVNFLGHAPEFVRDAVRRQLDRGMEIGPQSRLAGRVAEGVKRFTGMDRVSFCNTGSEAVMAAMRVARTVSGRWRVVYFRGDYHGMFDEVLATSRVLGGTLHTLPAAPGIPKRTVEGNLILEYGSPDALRIIEEFADEIAAVIVEPIQSRYPDVRPRQFLHQLRDLTRDRDIALVFDEVITGFRVHPGGAQAWYGVEADLATYGKVIGGGMPIGVVAGRERYMDVLDGGAWRFGDDSVPEADVTFFAGTFVRHPLALAAAEAVLEHLEAEGPELQERVTAMTADFVADVNAFFEGRGVPIRLRTFSSWFRFDYPSDLSFAQLLFYHLVLRGVYIREAGQNCFFSTVHTAEDVARVRSAIEESVIELLEAGFLPGGEPDADAPHAEPVRLPLTSAQMEVWVPSQLGPEQSCAYNESVTLKFDGALDRAAMHRALNGVVARHDALRIRTVEGGEEQEVLPRVTLDLPVVDLSDLDSAEQSARWDATVEEDASTPFDLTDGPLIRATLVRFGPERHWMLLTGHHLVFDGWSSNVVVGDLRALYNQEVEGVGPALEAPMQFSEYIDWLASQQGTEEYEAARRFWLDRFAEPFDPLELPSDRPRKVLSDYASRTIRFEIDAELTRAAKRLGASRGSTLFATLLAVYSAWLRRISGKTDVVVGVPAAGQALVGSDDLVGHCVHFLPMRLAVREEDLPFDEYLDRVKRQAFDASAHQLYTYGTLLDELPPGVVGANPRIEAHFNLEKLNHPGLGEEGRFSGLDFEADENPKRFTVSDVFLNFLETDDGLTVDCRYNADLFEDDTMRAWIEALRSLLRTVVDEPTTLLSEIPLHGRGAEGGTVLPDRPDDAGRFVLDSVRGHAAAKGSDVAVVGGDRSLTYGELEQRSGDLAGALVAAGVKAGDLVGVLLDRTVEIPEVLLGIWKAGAAWLPLDPDFPAERLALMVEDAAPAAMVTHAHLADAMPPFDGPVIEVAEGGAPTSDTPLPPAAGAEDRAYVIYTSGSTGRPKGVEIPFRAVENLLRSMEVEPGLTSSDRLLAVTTLSFDISILELLLPLVAGATVHIADRTMLSDPAAVIAALDGDETTVMQATPTFWRMLLDAGWSGSPGVRAFSGGEPLPRDLADRILECVDGLWNLYGPTETTIWSTCARVEPAGSVTIGRPIANTRTYVLDEHGQRAPVGVPGELWIGGWGVALGYLGRPDLTTERFRPDPFAPDGGRMYRTGDRATLRADGSLTCHGRLDDQVKVHGYRVELGEIEAVLGQHEGVRQAVAVAHGGERLVAHFVAERSPPPTGSELRRYLRGKLPEYMVPGLVSEIDAVPRTANGKVDRAALPDPMAPTATKEFTPPSSDAEKTLARIWAELLETSEIGVHDNFFELGGHSLLAIRAVAEFQKETGVRLDARQFFFSTLAQIAEGAMASGAS